MYICMYTCALYVCVQKYIDEKVNPVLDVNTVIEVRPCVCLSVCVCVCVCVSLSVCVCVCMCGYLICEEWCGQSSADGRPAQLMAYV